MTSTRSRPPPPPPTRSRAADRCRSPRGGASTSRRASARRPPMRGRGAGRRLRAPGPCVPPPKIGSRRRVSAASRPRTHEVARYSYDSSSIAGLTGGELRTRSTPSAGTYCPTTAARDRSQRTLAAPCRRARRSRRRSAPPAARAAGRRSRRGRRRTPLERAPHVDLALVAAGRLSDVAGGDPERGDATRIAVQPARRQQAGRERQAHGRRASGVAQLAVDLRADGVERVQVARRVEVEQLGDELVAAVEDGEPSPELEVLRAVADALGGRPGAGPVARWRRTGTSPSPLGGSTAGDGGSGGRPLRRAAPRPRRAAPRLDSVRPTGAGGRSSASSAIGTGGALAALDAELREIDLVHGRDALLGAADRRVAGGASVDLATGRVAVTGPDELVDDHRPAAGGAPRGVELLDVLAQRDVDAARARQLGEGRVEDRRVGASRSAIAASWLNGLASAATARIPWPTARPRDRAGAGPGIEDGVAGLAANAASSASRTLSAGGGAWRSRRARPGRRLGRTTWSSPVRSASVINRYGSSTSSSSSSGSPEYSGRVVSSSSTSSESSSASSTSSSSS